MREIAFIEQSLNELIPYVKDRYAFRAALDVSSKSEPNDVLTEVDLTVQRDLVRRIESTFPGDHVVGEEDGRTRPPTDTQARCWYIDPIDGTQNFVRGLLPSFGISVAFAQHRQVLAAGVALPGLDALFLAEKGGGSTLNGAPIAVSEVESMGLARADIDFGTSPRRLGTLTRARELFLRFGQIRSECSAVIALCAVACGESDAYFHVYLNPWDFAAGMLLIQEAGGSVTTLKGNGIDMYDCSEGLLASNGRIHREILQYIGQDNTR